ncbi:hypothetical protein GOM44_02725 [Wolbachia endosymbiont of Atemnus politus]|uniref:hypothetical protein n=1 Tax=Wolbachia endosymbiont of Atemnus politus TaxID=2682840 RepID=UPI001571F053|nr:hypothetical protein [Wolbachia endosymbiont of Atemnus politus]NSX83346.1 hypothetical protein [Wolbachia endosymbiont of Atemnus politus]
MTVARGQGKLDILLEKTRMIAANKAMKTGGICGIVAALAVGIGCGVAGMGLPILSIVGIALAAALAVGLVAGGITYAVSKPGYKLDETYVPGQKAKKVRYHFSYS